MGIVKNVTDAIKKSQAESLIKREIKRREKLNQAANILEGNKSASHTSGGSSWSMSGGGEKWPFGMSTSYASFFLDHYKLRQQARKAMQDTPMARALVSRLHTSIVGRGLKAQFKPRAKLLGITPEEAEAWGAKVSELVDMWASSKKCHRSQQLTFYQAQDLYAMWTQRDGDMFTRLFYSASKDLLSPVQFDFLDPNQISGNAYTDSDRQYQQRTDSDGITKNSDGTERSYKVWVTGDKGKIDYKEIPRKGPKSGRLFMLHGFKPEYAGQTRGFSPLAHGLQDFENAQDFILATIKKAINQSNLVMSVENQQQAPSGAGVDSWVQKKGLGFKSDVNTKEETVVKDSGCRFELKPANEAVIDTPGSILFTENDQGDTIKMLENKVPSEGFGAFITPFFSFLSSSLNVPLEYVLMQFNKSYSASRAAIVVFYRIVLMWRDEIKADLIKPIIEMLLAEWISAGKISAPGWQDPVLKEAWLYFELIGTPMPSIDPDKEMKANKAAIEIGADNQESVARAYNGSSASDNLAVNRRLYPETPTPPWESGGQMVDDQNTNEDDNEEEDDGE